MITVLCLNPSMDKTATIDTFHHGGMNRIRSVRVDASGKGINVALNIQRLGGACFCAGFAGEQNGGAILEKLGQERVAAHFEMVPGAVRTNVKLLEEDTRVITEINEPGPYASPEAQEALIQKIIELSKRSSMLILTGSLPQGCPTDLYATIIQRVKADAPDCRCALDAEGPVFTAGLKARPTLVKPNRYELELYAGGPCQTIRQVQNAALNLCAEGIDIVVVSMGKDGAFATDGSSNWYAPALQIPIRSTVGAGDAMLAGFAYQYAKGESLSEAFRYAVAVASATVTQEGTQPVSLPEVEALLPQVRLVSL